MTDKPVQTAAVWLAATPPRSDAIQALRERFGLSALQAAEACRIACRLRSQPEGDQ